LNIYSDDENIPLIFFDNSSHQSTTPSFSDDPEAEPLLSVFLLFLIPLTGPITTTQLNQDFEKGNKVYKKQFKGSMTKTKQDSSLSISTSTSSYDIYI
jgi:hypothetical protein